MGVSGEKLDGLVSPVSGLRRKRDAVLLAPLATHQLGDRKRYEPHRDLARLWVLLGYHLVTDPVFFCEDQQVPFDDQL